MLTPQNRLLCGVLFLGLLVLDQISKTWVVGTFDLGQRVDVTPFFRLTLEYNEGIGLSMFSFLYDWIQGGSQLVFGVINIVISGFILYFARHEERRLALVGWTLVLAGAIGNAFDRFVALGTERTGVVDFIWLHWSGAFNFPVFNIADTAITIGFIVVLIDMFFVNPAADDRMEQE